MSLKNLLSHYFFLATAILAVTGWVLNIIGVSLLQKQNNGWKNKNPVSLNWFWHFYYLFCIVIFLATIAMSRVHTYRLLLLAFLTAAFVFTVLDCDGAYNRNAAGDIENNGSTSFAGLIILAITFALWIIVLGSAENSRINQAANLELPLHKRGRTSPVAGEHAPPAPGPPAVTQMHETPVTVVQP
ncbi:hypothetical protein HK104_003768 [Borealophlyctis nickersoniae]|nr:hypothetical protein HK104_003768 [Borealophlyctis nickersoniae]